MGEIDGAFRSWGFARGGTGAISNAIADAAREAGVEIRTEGAGREDQLVKRQGARGVVLENGDEIDATVVVSSVDPRLTFLKLIGAKRAARRVRRGHQALQVPRLVGQGEPRARRAAGLHLPARRRARTCAARSRSRPSVEYMERAYDDAKYGRFSRRPYIDMVIPSLTDPSVAPPGKHVMSCFVQYAPYKLKDRHLGRGARGVRRHRHRHDRRVRAEHQEHHPAPPGR